MGRGRPSKTGKRKNGRRVPDIATFDKGSAWVQAQRERYGQHYCWALGRAYASGLLGEGDEAKDRLDAGRKFARIYNRVIGPVGVYACPLDDTPRGRPLAVDDPERTERELKDKAWLWAIMDSLDVAGVRPYLDQLIHTNYTDSGPHWLEPLLANRWMASERHWRLGKPQGHPVDLMLLGAALKALDIIAPERRGRMAA